MAGVVNRYWVGTVSREHVLTGVKGGFCQVCHGKKGPLARMKEGDWLIYYSPKMSMGGKEACQKFTAIGKIADSKIYQFKMSDNFVPFRRNVVYLNNIKEQAIHPLLRQLSFTKEKGSKWGSAFRFGMFEISKDDFELIYQRMVNDVQPNKKRKLEENSITNNMTEKSEQPQSKAVDKPSKKICLSQTPQREVKKTSFSNIKEKFL